MQAHTNLLGLSDLILDDIIDCLPLADYVALAGTCKGLWSRPMSLVEIFGPKTDEQSLNSTYLQAHF